MPKRPLGALSYRSRQMPVDVSLSKMLSSALRAFYKKRRRGKSLIFKLK